MPLKFAANISTMFQEIPSLAARYKAAKDAGFLCVEVAFPYDKDTAENLGKACASAGVNNVHINAYPGDLVKGDFGLASLPDCVNQFRETLEVSIQYAKALKCKRMHVLSGKKPVGIDVAGLQAMEETYINNLKYAANRLQQEGILTLIEAISDVVIPDYYLCHPQQAFDFVKKIGHPNLKVQFDFYHVQVVTGNLTKNLKEQLPYIGHIQVSQVPDMGEPDTEGEICYPYIFHLIDELGYQGYIGLEYKSRGDTLEGLKWMKELDRIVNKGIT